MTNERIRIGFFFLIIIGVLILNIFVFFPYLSVLFLALVFSIVFLPVHRKILTWVHDKEVIASLLSVLVIMVVILAPTFFFSALLLDEANSLYVSVVGSGGNGTGTSFDRVIERFENFIIDYVPGFSLNTFNVDLQTVAGEGLSWVINNFSVIFSKFLAILFGLFLMFMAIFYFLKDGGKFLNSLMALSPLEDTYDKKIMSRIAVAINSVVRGHLIIAVIQGILAGFGFFLFGVPSPVIWGFVTALASLVPGLGTAIILSLGIIFLVIMGSLAQAIGLLVWGVAIVGLVDNFLGPILINRNVNIHPFLILISALGGIAFFGPVGFIAGPVLLSLLFTLFDLYPLMLPKKES